VSDLEIGGALGDASAAEIREALGSGFPNHPLNDLIRGAVSEGKPEGRYAFIFPQRNQAKDTAWRYLRRYAEPLLAKPPCGP
jgi:hypothetical protein